MTRLGTLVLAAAAAGFLGAMAFGNPLLSVVFLVPGAGIALWSERWRSSRAQEHQWTAPRDTTTAPARSDPAPAVRVARALGRVEARELATQPWFGAGIGICTLVALIVVTSINFEEPWSEIVSQLPYLAHPLVGMAILASHRNATRSARDGTDELFDSCPTAPAVRTIGALWSAWVPVASLAVFFAAYLVLTNVFSPAVHGPLEFAMVVTVLAGLVLGAGGVALGVALGRWVRFALAPIVAIVVVGYLSIQLAHGDPGQFETRMVFSTFGPTGDSGQVEFTAGQASANLAWLLTITALTGFVAVAAGRGGGHRQRVMATVAMATGTGPQP